VVAVVLVLSAELEQVRHHQEQAEMVQMASRHQSQELL
jgi:hypothetical protein